MRRLDEQQIVFLRDLAEGRLDPGDWLAWWDENAAAIEAVVSQGLFLSIKPGEKRGHSAFLLSRTSPFLPRPLFFPPIK